MSRRVAAGDLSKAIAQDLTAYSKEVQDAIAEAAREAAEELVDITRATAPETDTEGRRHFKRSIAYKELQGVAGVRKYVWYVKPPNYRLTHLLVHGHATPDGGRTAANPFLQDALDKVLPKYEQAVEEAIKR